MNSKSSYKTKHHLINNIHRLYGGNIYRNSIKKRIQTNIKNSNIKENIYSSLCDDISSNTKTPSKNLNTKPPPSLFNSYNNNIIKNKHFRNKTQLIGNNINTTSSILQTKKEEVKGKPVLLMLNTNSNKNGGKKNNNKYVPLSQVQTPKMLSPVNSNNTSIIYTNNSNQTNDSINSKSKAHHRKTLSLELGINRTKNLKEDDITSTNSASNSKRKNSKFLSDNSNNVVNIVNGVNDKNVEINFNKFEIKILSDNDNKSHKESTKHILNQNIKRASFPRTSQSQRRKSSFHCENELSSMTTSQQSVIQLIKRKSISLTKNQTFHDYHNKQNTSKPKPIVSKGNHKFFTVTTSSAQILGSSNFKELSEQSNTQTQFNLLIPCRANNIIVKSPEFRTPMVHKRQSFNKELLIKLPQTNQIDSNFLKRNNNKNRRMTFTQSLSLHNNFNRKPLKSKYKEGDSFRSIGSLNKSDKDDKYLNVQNEQDKQIYKNKKQVTIYQQNSSFLNSKTQTNNTFGNHKNNTSKSNKTNRNNNNNVSYISPSKKCAQENILFELEDDNKENNNDNDNGNEIVENQLHLSLKEFDTSSSFSNEEDNKDDIIKQESQNKNISQIICSPIMKKEKNVNFFTKRSASNFNTSPFLFGKASPNQKKRTNVLNLLSSPIKNQKNTKESIQTMIQPFSQNRTFKRKTKNTKSQKKLIKQLSNIPEIFTRNEDKIQFNNKCPRNNCSSSTNLITNSCLNFGHSPNRRSSLNKSQIFPSSKKIFDEIIEQLNESSFKIPNSSSYSSSRESSFNEDTLSEDSRKTGTINLNSVSFSKQGSFNFFDKRALSVIPFTEMKFAMNKKNHTEKDLNTLKKLQNQIDDIYQSIFDNNATVEIKESLLNKALLSIDVKCEKFQEKRERTIKRLTDRRMTEIFNSNSFLTFFSKEQFFEEDNPNENELFETQLEHSFIKHLHRDFSNTLSTFITNVYYEVDLYKQIYEEKYLQTELGESITINLNLPNNQIITVNTLFDNFKFYRLPIKAKSTISLFKRKSKKNLLSKTIHPLNSQISLIQFSKHLWNLLMHNKVEALPSQDKQFYWSFVIKDCLKHTLDSKPSDEYIIKVNETLPIQRKQRRELTRKSPVKKIIFNRTSTTTNFKRKSCGVLNISKRSFGGFNKIFESQNTLFHTSNILNMHKRDFSILNNNKHLYERGDDRGNLSYDGNSHRIKHKGSFALTQNPPTRNKKRFSFSYSALPLDRTNEDGYFIKKERNVYRTNEIKFGLLKRFNNYNDFLFFYVKDGNADNFRDVFLKFKIDPETKDKDGNTFLNLAVQCDCLKIVVFLINYGANVNTQNKKLNTPLHYALSYQNFILSDLLIKSGADESIKNLKGVTPWQCLNNKFSIM